ncbi:hypothetical protein ACH0BU_17610, partial [Sphingomonas olei]
MSFNNADLTVRFHHGQLHHRQILDPSFRSSAMSSSSVTSSCRMFLRIMRPFSTRMAQSARSCDFGHLGEHVGNGLVVVDD